MQDIIYSTTFIQDSTKAEITVWTQPGQSAFSALYNTLRQQGWPIKADWRLVPTQSRRLVAPKA